MSNGRRTSPYSICPICKTTFENRPSRFKTFYDAGILFFTAAGIAALFMGRYGAALALWGAPIIHAVSEVVMRWMDAGFNKGGGS
jgi:hypothetical protein